MSRRSDVVEAMAHELGGQVGAPSCPEAAADLAKLYEATTGMTLLELAHQAPPVDGLPPGSVLAMLALGELELGAVPFRVPAFQIERRGRQIVWEGADAVSNPAKPKPGLRFIVIAPTAARQRAMTKVVKKAYPRSTVIVSDNAGAATANIEVHDVDVVVTEYHLLGGTTGDDVLGWVEENRPSLAERFVFMSDDKQGKIGRHVRADADEDDLRRSLRGDVPATRAAAAPTAPSRPVPMAPTVGTLVVPTTPRRAPPPPVAAAEPDDATFDQMVLDAVPRVAPDGWFGQDKIFLAALWDVMKTDPRVGSLTLAQFKRRLAIAQQESRFLLARADLVGAMDPRMVRDSEFVSPAGTLHFLLAPGSREYQYLERPAVRPAPVAATKRESQPSTAAFAEMVRQAMAGLHGSGRSGPRFGARKVFISAIWNRLRDTPKLGDMTFDQFARRLIEANRAGDLVLARADFVSAMDPSVVSASEIVLPGGGATWHFVVDPDATGI